MKIELKNNKFVVDPNPEMTFEELERLLPIPAITAVWDIGQECKGDTPPFMCAFRLIDGDLYAKLVGTYSHTQWYWYDTSVRRWHKTDAPDMSMS